METVLTIEKMSYGPKAIAHNQDGKTVFVAGGVPGDIVSALTTSQKKSFDEAAVLEVITPSPLRTNTPHCTKICGGCPWSSLDYPAQLQEKADNVFNALVRMGKLNPEFVQSILRKPQPSPEIWGYRNKIELEVRTEEEFSVQSQNQKKSFCKSPKENPVKPHLGLHQISSNKLVEIETCPLVHPTLQNAPQMLRTILPALMPSSRNTLGVAKLFRIGLRHSNLTQELEIALWTTPGTFPEKTARELISGLYPQAGIIRVIARPGKEREIISTNTLKVPSKWIETLESPLGSCIFETQAPSFFQVNSLQAEKLIALSLEALALFFSPHNNPHDFDSLKNKHIADLYAGGGTFSIPLAKAGARVTSVEIAESSTTDLEQNALNNNVSLFIKTGDTGKLLPQLSDLDALIVDPPRMGLGRNVIESIAQAAPQAVVYVSCDPQTLGRDIALFSSVGYEPKSIQPVDLFPQTYHIENVCLLTRSSDTLTSFQFQNSYI